MSHLKKTLVYTISFLTLLSQSAFANRVEVGGIAIKIPGHAAITHNDVKSFALARYSSIEHQKALFISANRDYDSYQTLLNSWLEINKQRAYQDRAEFAALLVQAKEYANDQNQKAHMMYFEAKDLERVMVAIEPTCAKFSNNKRFVQLSGTQSQKANALVEEGFPNKQDESSLNVFNRYCRFVYDQSQELLRNKAALDYVVQRRKFDPTFSTYLAKNEIFSKIKKIGNQASLERIHQFNVKEPMASLYIKNITSYSNAAPKDYLVKLGDKTRVNEDLLSIKMVFSQKNVKSLLKKNLEVVNELMSASEEEFNNARKAAYKSFLISNSPVSTYNWKLYQLAHLLKENKLSAAKSFRDSEKQILEVVNEVSSQITADLDQTIDSLLFISFLKSSPSKGNPAAKSLSELIRWSLNLNVHASLNSTIGIIEFFGIDNEYVREQINEKLSEEAINSEKKKALQKLKRDLTINLS